MIKLVDDDPMIVGIGKLTLTLHSETNQDLACDFVLAHLQARRYVLILLVDPVRNNVVKHFFVAALNHLVYCYFGNKRKN